MSKECGIVKDLLPLYLDNLVSSETVEFVKSHLEQCEQCRAEYEKLQSEAKKYSFERTSAEIREREAMPIKKLKKKLTMRRLVVSLVSAVLTIAILLFAIELIPAKIDYGESILYSHKDMDDAIKLIKAKFGTWNGCKLYTITYAGDGICKRELDYCNELADEGETFTECIVFKTDFRSPIFGGGAWNENTRYNWNWYLARNSSGDWKLLTWGVG